MRSISVMQLKGICYDEKRVKLMNSTNSDTLNLYLFCLHLEKMLPLLYTACGDISCVVIINHCAGGYRQ